MIELIVKLVIGAFVGWLAGKIMNNNGSTLRNIIIGLVGGYVGGWVFGLVGFTSSNWVGGIISATVGACILLWIGKKVFK